MNRKHITKHLILLNSNYIVTQGLLKNYSYVKYSTTINYTNKPCDNNIYNTCFIEIPKDYSRITLKSNNGNNIGQANSYIIFANDYYSAGTRITSAGKSTIEINLNHNYKYIAIPLGINTTYPIANNFYSFDTATFEFS